MGAFDWLAGRRPPEVEPIDLGSDEFEVARTPGSVMTGGMSWVGGDLVLTNQRLLMTPVNTKDLVALAAMGVKVVQAATGPIPHVGQVMTVIGWAQKLVKGVSSDAETITAVSVGQRGPSLLKPPTILVQRASAPMLEFGVVATRLTPNISSKNVDARDRFLAAIIRTFGLNPH